MTKIQLLLPLLIVLNCALAQADDILDGAGSNFKNPSSGSSTVTGSGDQGDDFIGGGGSILGACKSQVDSKNDQLSSGCKAYCQNQTVSHCLDRCYGDNGFSSDGGYIYDITSFCQNNSGVLPSWKQPPPPPPAATPSSAPAHHVADAAPDDITGSIPKSAPATAASVPPTTTPAKTPDPKPEDKTADKPVEKSPNPSSGASASCGSDLSSAQSACRQQPSTPQAQQGGGINGSCQQMTNAGVSASQQWGQIASQCQSAIATCDSSCSGDDSRKSSCDSLSSNVDNAIAMQNNSSSAAGGSGLGCQQQAGNGQPGGASPASASPSSSPQAVPASSSPDCSSPVNSAQCAVNKSQTAATDKANSASMQDASAPMAAPHGAGSFNVGDPGRESQNAKFGEDQQQGQGGRGGAGGLGPFGGGGGSSSGFGAGNGSSPGAGGPARPAGFAGAQGKDSGVQVKEKSGGGYSNPVSRALASVSGNGSFSGFGGYGTGSPDDLSRARGMDLKQYLPGGLKDGTRRLSGVNFAHPDIHGANENMWLTISNRFQVHCKLQLLVDCH